MVYNVDLTWVLPDKGGKLFQPKTGEYFCTTVLIDLNKGKSTWSIKLIFSEEQPLKAKLQFLFDTYPKNLLDVGDTIKLFEGPNVVGYALIKNIE